MPFSADLSFAGLPALLYTLELNREDLVVVLDGPPEPGRIVLAKGRIADALCGTASGSAALTALLECAAGTVRLEPSTAPAEPAIVAANPALLTASPLILEEPGAGARIEGDGELFSVVDLLELLAFSGVRARVRSDGAELVVARGTLVEASFGGQQGREALFRMLERGVRPFTASPEPAAAERPDLPLAVELAAALERLADAEFLRRRGVGDEVAILRSLVEDLNAGRVSREVRLALARRLMPGPSVTPVDTVARLCLDEDEGIRNAAKETVESLDLEVLLALMASPAMPMPLMGHLIDVFRSDAEVLAAAAGNPSLDEPLAVRLAQMADVTVADALLHSKWGNAPAVREALGRDSDATARQARAHEAPTSAAATAVPAGAASGTPPAAAPKGGGKVAKRRPIGSLSLKEQLFLAAGGNQRQQLTLVCSPTGAVACAVINSPRMNENTALSIANMATANGEALRELVGQRRYSFQYPIARTLAFNPKTPPGSVIELLPRLKDSDLKSLSRSSGVADTVRTTAARMLAQREEKRKL